ncbi:predicted protein [Brucella sp. NVSL 07-0026]|nr:predicted protein [Brucella sp. NVSL 07-0026]
MAAMLDLALQSLPAMPAATNAVRGEKRGRVAILNGCAQPVLNPGINAATLRLLNRFDIEVATPKGEGCCGSLVHHMGREEQALEQARHNVDVWTREIETGGLDAIIVTASGCGTTSRITAICCVLILPIRIRRRAYRHLRRISRNISPRWNCRNPMRRRH